MRRSCTKLIFAGGNAQSLSASRVILTQRSMKIYMTKSTFSILHRLRYNGDMTKKPMTPEEILKAFVAENAPAQIDIARGVGIGTGTSEYHIKRLVEDGRLAKSENNRLMVVNGYANQS